MNGDPKLYNLLSDLSIAFEYIEHPPAPTVELAKMYVSGRDVQRCKNLFLRNHKGNQHFLVVLDCNQNMDVHAIEKILKQGKLTFASPRRLSNYLGVTPGSVTPLGLIYDTQREVCLFLDELLQNAKKLSFHPCINTASLVIEKDGFLRFLKHLNIRYQWMKLY